MKRKTFCVTLLLFLVFINSSMLIVSVITLRECVGAEREKVLAEHYLISSTLLGDMQAVEERGKDAEASVGDLAGTYLRYSRNRGNDFAISCEGKWIYCDADAVLESDPAALSEQTDQSNRIIFLEKKPVPRLCVYGQFPAPYQEYGLLYCADLGDTLNTWWQMKNVLFFVSMAVTFFFALFLIKFLNILFKPLRDISMTSRIMAEGDYNIRLHVHGRDEIAVMADNFNRMASQVESHIKQLQDTADRKQRFIDNFAHELRTPLTAVYGYAEYIQKASLTEKERMECTQFILSECKRLQNMAYQLLDMAALREIKTESCCIEELFSRTREIMQVKAEERGISLSFSSHREIVVGNQELLIALLTNLIDNALKVSSADGIVKISAKQTESSLILEVADQGIGMTKEQLLHIKEAFYRVDNSRSRAEGGAGLGLAICDRIVQLHHGELEFLSTPGKGTAARVILPDGLSAVWEKQTQKEM